MGIILIYYSNISYFLFLISYFLFLISYPNSLHDWYDRSFTHYYIRNDGGVSTNVIHSAHLGIHRSSTVHLGNDDILLKRSLLHTLGNTFVDGSESLAPRTPGSKKVYQNYGFGGGQTIEIINSFDHSAVCLGRHLANCTQISIVFH